MRMFVRGDTVGTVSKIMRKEEINQEVYALIAEEYATVLVVLVTKR